MKTKFIYLIIVVLTFFACEDDGGRPDITADELISSGWVNFEVGEYALAVTDFNSAIAKDASAFEAYSGIGWSQIRLDEIDNAETNFLTALNGNYAGKELLAGLAAISLVNEEYTTAIGYAESILNIDPDWFFEHDNSIDFKDVWFVVAVAYFHEGDFPEVEAAILKIDTTYSINKDDSATWIVGSITFGSYEEAVGAYLQNLPSELNI